jgi:monoterpene epsilon-lactone hydrolase
MRTSIRARLMRRAVRRARLGGQQPLEVRRDKFDKRTDRLPRPRRVVYEETKVAGREAIVATPTDLPPDRHILYIHGGGYMLGSPRSHIALAARLAKRASASTTVIDYRLAPEHPYPAAIDDCLAAYRAVISEYGPAMVAVAGDSAGGNAVLATLNAARRAGDAMPACAYLLSPWTDLSGRGESIRTMADVDPMLDPEFIARAARAYAAHRALDDPGISPLFDDLTGLPPLLIQGGDREVLLDDSRRLADRATAAGVEVTLDLAEGMWHVYQAFAPFVPEASDALVRGAVFIRTKTPSPIAARH